MKCPKCQHENPDEAYSIIDEVSEILTECGADGWVEKYEKELAELS